MSKLLLLRNASAVAIALTATTALAGGDAPATNLEGTAALYMILGGVAIMVVVIWLLTIVIGKINHARSQK
jgi:hypothetical protein